MIPETLDRATTPVPLSRPVSMVEAAGATHRGLVRHRNEDAFAIAPELGLAVVADGLGAHPAGDIASQMATSEIVAHFRRRERSGAFTPPTIESLSEAVRHANHRIWSLSCERGPHAGMRTTVASLLVTPDRALLAHAGDSRVYRLRGGLLSLLTEDHTLAAEYLKRRGKDADRELLRQGASRLTRCLGSGPHLAVTVSVDPIEPGDIYVLCTDGVWALVEEDDMARAIEEAPSLPVAAEKLIELGNKAAGSDNLTAVIVRVPGNPIGALP